jgi:hypothetical protein
MPPPELADRVLSLTVRLPAFWLKMPSPELSDRVLPLTVRLP